MTDKNRRHGRKTVRRAALMQLLQARVLGSERWHDADTWAEDAGRVAVCKFTRSGNGYSLVLVRECGSAYRAYKVAEYLKARGMYTTVNSYTEYVTVSARVMGLAGDGSVEMAVELWQVLAQAV